MMISELKVLQEGVLSAVLQGESVSEHSSVEEYMNAFDKAARSAGYQPVGRPAWKQVQDRPNAIEMSVCLLPKVELGQYLQREVLCVANDTVPRELSGRIVDQLVQDSYVAVPMLAIDTEAGHQWLLLQSRLAKSGIALQQHLARLRTTEQAFTSKLRGYAEADMKKRIVLLAVAQAEGFTVAEEELQGAVLDAQRHGIRLPDRMQLRQKILAEKAIELIWQSSIPVSLSVQGDLA